MPAVAKHRFAANNQIIMRHANIAKPPFPTIDNACPARVRQQSLNTGRKYADSCTRDLALKSIPEKISACLIRKRIIAAVFEIITEEQTGNACNVMAHVNRRRKSEGEHRLFWAIQSCCADNNELNYMHIP